MEIMGKALAGFLFFIGGSATLYVIYNTIGSLLKEPIQANDHEVAQEDLLNRYKKGN